MRCPVCASTVFVYNESTHEYYCARCGYIISTIYNPTAITNLRISNIYESTHTFYVDAEKIVSEDQEFKRLNYVERKIFSTPIKKLMAIVYSYAEPLGLNIPPDYVSKMINYIKSRVGKVENKYLALFIVYLYAKEHSIPIDINDLAKRFNIEYKKIRSRFKKLIQKLNIKIVPDHEAYIYRIVEKYGLQNYYPEINDIYQKIYSEVYTRKPKTIAVLIIYILATRHKELYPIFKQVAEEYNVSVQLVRSLYKKLDTLINTKNNI